MVKNVRREILSVSLTSRIWHSSKKKGVYSCGYEREWREVRDMTELRKILSSVSLEKERKKKKISQEKGERERSGGWIGGWMDWWSGGDEAMSEEKRKDEHIHFTSLFLLVFCQV